MACNKALEFLVGTTASPVSFAGSSYTSTSYTKQIARLYHSSTVPALGYLSLEKH